MPINSIRSILVITGIWLFSCSVFAQQKKYIYKRYGKANGLVSENPNWVVQEKNEYLWIATGRGLQRFDGKHFVNFKHNSNDKNSIIANEIAKLLIDKKNRLWIIFEGNRIGYLNTGNFIFTQAKIMIPESHKRNTITDFREDDAGNIYFTVQNLGILTYREDRNEFSAAHNMLKLPDGGTILDYVSNGIKDNYLVVTQNGIATCNAKTNQWAWQSQNPFLATLNKLIVSKKAIGPGHFLVDRKGRTWFDIWQETKTDAGPAVYCYDSAAKKWISYKTSLDRSAKGYYSLWGILEQRNGDIWVYGTNVFAKLNEKENAFEDVRNEFLEVNSLEVETIYNLYEDKDANIWISSSNGLFMFNPGRQIFSNMANRRNGEHKEINNTIEAVLESRTGAIYVSTWGAGIFAYDNKFNVLTDAFTKSLNHTAGFSGWDMHERKNGEIWIAMQGGSVIVYSPESRRSVDLRLSVFDGKTVRQVAEDSLGNMWMGTQYGRIIKCTGANWRDTAHAFAVVQELKGRITKLVTDNAGFVWACTDRFGLYQIRAADGKIVNHFDIDSKKGSRLQSSTVNDILQYNDSLYLVGNKGLHLLNRKTGHVSFLTTGEETDYSNIMSITRDKQGYIWIAFSDGLSRMKYGKKILLNFKEEDGISNPQFQINAATVLRDGRVILGTSTDLLIFDPAKVKVSVEPEPVSISAFSVADKALLVDSILKLKTLTLPYYRNSITIDFTSFSFLDDHALIYTLEGLEDKWSVAKTNSVAYNLLPPGKYKLKLKSVAASGKESEITGLQIRITPPFWKSWWFYALLTLTGIAIVYLADRERLLRIKATQRLRTDIALNLHDDVNTGLNNINLLSEMARMKVDKDISKSKELIEQISDKSNDMIIAMDDMLWVIDPANDSMEKTFDRIEEFADALQNRHQAEIILDIDEQVYKLNLDMKLRHGFFLILKSALRCMVQYAGAKKTEVNIDRLKDSLSIIMQANLPFSVNDANISKCTAEMKQYAANINAELDIHIGKTSSNLLLNIPVK